MKVRTSLRLATLAFVGVAVVALAAACSDDDNGGSTGGTSPTATSAAGTGSTGGSTGSTGVNLGSLSGTVEIDGSSTVFPITEAVAEEFRGVAGNVRVPVGVSGTGGGFSRFCSGETDISNASRPIRSGADSESTKCEAAGVSFVEIPVAYDGLSVVVHPDNDWLECITVDQLETIWSPDSEGKVTKWNDVDPSWPDQDILLYGPGTDSGTFDYFTEVINGSAGASRTDFTPSEDDNVLVQGVAGSRYALGYFGLAYLEENVGRIKGVEVDGGNGCVEPSQETVESGEYAPLSRPLFIYVKVAAADRPEVQAFVEFYLDNVPELAADVGYVAFPSTFYDVIRERWEDREGGSIFSGEHGSVGEILGVN